MIVLIAKGCKLLPRYYSIIVLIAKGCKLLPRYYSIKGASYYLGTTV